MYEKSLQVGLKRSSAQTAPPKPLPPPAQEQSQEQPAGSPEANPNVPPPPVTQDEANKVVWQKGDVFGCCEWHGSYVEVPGMKEVEIVCRLQFNSHDFTLRGKGYTLGLEDVTFSIRGSFDRNRRTAQFSMRRANERSIDFTGRRRDNAALTGEWKVDSYRKSDQKSGTWTLFHGRNTNALDRKNTSSGVSTVLRGLASMEKDFEP